MDEIQVTRSDDGVVTLKLNRPQRKNAVTFEMWDELRSIFQTVSNSPDDRVLVITGEGEGFCAGADLAAGQPDRHPIHAMAPVNSAAIALHECSKPTIAKVNGDAVGAGMNLALGCDLIVASDRARFSEIFRRRALSLDFGGSWLLPRLIGLHKAKELALFGDIINAEEAEGMGLVNRVVPHEELDLFVDDWAKRLLDGPPLALGLSKKLLNNAFHQGLSESLEAEASAQTVNLTSQDVREGFAAFLEKRPPKFQGR
ncbi:MAG: enoyl-CoA hydratase [Myxococcota bacterium]|jgi:2-(1,2-epoxy-1,2-dihydrophenyl)acetyl-CoA isomerase|nr:enoyl-CoA hydratase [Myxococcota bacterium]